jgi:uncharacterized protein YcbX
MPQVARISITPVKSMALLHPDEVMLTDVGVPWDRLFYLVDGGGRLFTTRREGNPTQPVVPAYEPEREDLSLTFPDGSVVRGPASELGEPLVTDFYGRPVRAHVVRGPWQAALSAYLETHARLARCDRPGDGTDVYHATLMSSASVAEVGKRGGHDGDLDGRRFRMTFELDGCTAHEEDTWAGHPIRIGKARLRVYGQVPRCVVTTQHPETGLKDFDTLKAITAYRGLMPNGTGIPFGMYAEVEQPGRVRVGDDVRVLG